jgi:uncharacterized protein YeaC (DUF1315 family)
MIKKIITTAVISTALLMGASKMANAFTIYKVGQVDIYQNNEILNKALAHDIKVYTGIDPDGHKLTQLQIDTGLKTLKVNLWQGEKEYETWMSLISKGTSWAKIAKENKVDYSKDLPDCSTYGVTCSVRFRSISNGENSALVFNIEDSENSFYDLKNAFIMAEDMSRLSVILTEKVPAKLSAIEEDTKNKPKVNKDELFK